MIPADLIQRHGVKIRFLAVGLWNTFFGYFVFLGLDFLFARTIQVRYAAYMSALVLSNVLAIINAFIFHKYITFKSETRGRETLFEFFRFTSTYVVTFCLSLVLMPVFVELLSIVPAVSGALVILVCTVISFLGHSRFSFRNGNLERQAPR